MLWQQNMRLKRKLQWAKDRLFHTLKDNRLSGHLVCSGYIRMIQRACKKQLLRHCLLTGQSDTHSILHFLKCPVSVIYRSVGMLICPGRITRSNQEGSYQRQSLCAHSCVDSSTPRPLCLPSYPSPCQSHYSVYHVDCTRLHILQGLGASQLPQLHPLQGLGSATDQALWTVTKGRACSFCPLLNPQAKAKSTSRAQTLPGQEFCLFHSLINSSGPRTVSDKIIDQNQVKKQKQPPKYIALSVIWVSEELRKEIQKLAK